MQREEACSENAQPSTSKDHTSSVDFGTSSVTFTRKNQRSFDIRKMCLLRLRSGKKKKEGLTAIQTGRGASARTNISKAAKDRNDTEMTAILANYVDLLLMTLLVADPNGERKFILEEEEYNATNFMTMWEFEGILKYSPLFYGWYTNNDSNKGYRLPFAYFITGLVVYAYSFVATLRKMAENSRVSKLSEKDDECIFSWKLFTGWDYMIGNAETAQNRVASIVMGFKEALLEEAEKKKDTRNWKVISFRILVNIVIIGLLAFSVYAVVMVVQRSTQSDANSTFWRKNEIAVVMTIITMVFPFLFEILGFLEQYHPRKQLRLQLARIMVLNLLNLYSLIFALFVKIDGMTKELNDFKNLTERTSQPTVEMTTVSYIDSTDCAITCVSARGNEIESDSLIQELAYNISTTAFPKLSGILEFLQSKLINSTANYDENLTDFSPYENITSDYNEIYGNVSVFNDSVPSMESLNITDLTYSFADYLTYILSSWETPNKTILDDFNESSAYPSTTELSTTELSSVGFQGTNNYDIFISTIAPVMAKTLKTTEISEIDRFDNDLDYLYNEITSTINTLKENCTKICENVKIPIYKNTTSLAVYDVDQQMNYTTKARLRSLCWETMFGQELVRLTVMDLVMTIVSTLAMDFFRAIFVRVMNRCWCWDLEKVFPQYGDFKVAENILSLVNNQGMVWMGMFFSPGLVVLNVVKLYIMMYFRAWAVLTCNVPHEVIFRASRSNNFYYALLLMMLFLCVLPVGYAVVWIHPSWHCGPFSTYTKIFHIFTHTIRKTVPQPLQKVLDYIASPAIVIPLLLLLVLIIYYLVSLTNALRGANEELKIQLRRERTEERRKMFQLVDRRRQGGSGESAETPFNKWKRLLGSLQGTKSIDDTPKQDNEEILDSIKEEKHENKGKDFFSKLLKIALRRFSMSEDDQNAGDATDNEQHDSLPEDPSIGRQNRKPRPSWGGFEFQDIANQALQMKKKMEPLTKDSEEVVDTKPVQNSDVQKSFQKTSEESGASSSQRQDSDSSVWSDNIPVITISKTISNENIIEGNSHKNNQHAVLRSKETKFHPKIKCVLRKQSTQIDEDTIRYFNDDLERNITECRAMSEMIDESPENSNVDRRRSPDLIEDIELVAEDGKSEEISNDKSSSDETEQQGGSVETILNLDFSVED